MTNGTSSEATFDVKRAWKQTKQTLGSMTTEQRRQSLVNSGILTKGGNVAKPYAKAIK